MPETLIAFGSEVKAVGDGKVEGYLVKFGSVKKHDLARDYFTKGTDFAVDFPAKSPIYYHHGADAKLGKTIIGHGSMKADDVGIWFSGQLEKRNAYERAVYKLVEENKTGFSSGTAPHLVEREAKTGEDGQPVFHITRWPLGLDASITTTPCESDGTGVVAAKSWDQFVEESKAAGGFVTLAAPAPLETEQSAATVSPEETNLAMKMSNTKAAMTDGERKKHAVVVRDNNHSHTAFASENKLHLFPVPPGDRNAAKTALAEMHSYPLTQDERQQVHDRAAKELGDEHKSDYCYYCQKDSMKSRDAAPPEQDAATLLSPSGDGETLQLKSVVTQGEEDMELKELVEAQAASIKTLTDGMTALTASVAELKAAAPAAPVEAPVAPAVADATKAAPVGEDITAAIKSAIAEGFAALSGRPLPRIPAGAQAATKTAGATVEGIVEGESQAEAIKAKLSARLAEVDATKAAITEKRLAGVKFTPVEDRQAEALVTEGMSLKSQIARLDLQ